MQVCVRAYGSFCIAGFLYIFLFWSDFGSMAPGAGSGLAALALARIRSCCSCSGLDPAGLLLLWPGSGLAALALARIRPACSCSGLDPALLLLLWPGSGLAALALSWIRPACSCSGPAFGGRSAGGWVDSVRCSIQPRILPFPAWRQVLGGAGLCVRRTVGKTAAFPHGGGFGLVFLFFGVG